MHHTKTKGDSAELKVAAKFIDRGYVVSRPLTDHAAYDLLVDDGKQIKRVQIKARSINRGSVNVPRFTSNRKYKDGEVDLIAVYCIDNGEIAVVEWDIFAKDGVDQVLLRVDAVQSGQVKNIRHFKDYAL